MRFFRVFLTIWLVLSVISTSTLAASQSSSPTRQKKTSTSSKSKKKVASKKQSTSKKKSITNSTKKRVTRKKSPRKYRRVASNKKSSKKATTKKKVTSHKRIKKRKVVSRTVRIPKYINSTKQLTYILNRVIRSTDPNAKVGVYIKTLNDDKVVYAHNIYRPLIPASIMKLLTAEAALLYLGPDYQFSTQLLTDAKSVKNGVLQGDLYIVLSGDPSLTYDDLVELMVSLKDEGIRSIKGNVYIDNTAYDERFYGPGWGNKDKKACYGAPISASIINHNCLPIGVKPARFTGGKAKVIKSSRHYYPGIKNSVVTKANRTRTCSLRLTTNSNSSISLDGCLRKDRESWGVQYVVTDIPEYNRSLFKSLLRRMSVDVYGSVTFGSAPDKLYLIASHESDELNLLMMDMLKRSDNVIAGAVFKKLGQIYSNKPGSWENGSKAVSTILKEKAKISSKYMRVIDGSGLSKSNKASPALFVQLLRFAYFNKKTSNDFITALPVAGVDGTLKNRMSNISKKVRAKTGTMSGVASLAGYATSRNRKPLAFVIIVNGSKGYTWRYRGMEDKIVTALTRFKA